MPAFEYVALHRSGRKVKDTLEAPSLEAAKASLRATGLTILEIRPQSVMNRDLELPFLGRPGAKDMAVFCRQFVSILRAGVSVGQALRLLSRQTANKKLCRAIADMQAAVEKGDALASAMGRHGDLFPNLLLSMVRAGESSGNLEESFRQMEIYFDRLKRTESKVRKAMTYPCVLMGAMVMVVVVMMVKILPMFLDTFQDMGAQLPLPTRVVMAVSDWLVAWWWLAVPVLLGLAAGLLLLGKRERGRRLFDWLALRLPLLRSLTERSACAALCRSLAILLASGLTLTAALELAADHMTNVYYRDAVRKLRQQIAEGVTLAAALEQEPLFPPMVCSLVGVGEEAGALEEMMTKVAEYYDEEISEATDRLMRLLEPCIVLLMAGFVLLIVLAIFLPMMSMTQAYDQYL